MSNWQSVLITYEEINKAENIYDLYIAKGVPLNDPKYIREVEKVDGGYLTRWVEKGKI